MVQVTTVAYAVNGQECVGECAQQGEDYWWCTKSSRWENDKPWAYCSPTVSLESGSGFNEVPASDNTSEWARNPS